MVMQIFHSLRIYAKLQLLHIRVHLEYEADFWIGIVGLLLDHGAGLIFVWALFSRVPEVKGWTLWEIAFLYSLSIIPRGLSELFCDGVWQIRYLVNTGAFDRLLLRPVSPAIQVVAQRTSIHGAGGVILGGVILGRAAQENQVIWNGKTLLLLFATILASTLIIGSIHYAANCTVFWDHAPNNAFPFLIENFSEFSKFPITLYGRSIQIFLTWILPFAFTSYYPGRLLLGKTSSQQWMGYLTPLMALVLFMVTSLVWRHALRHYQSTGH